MAETPEERAHWRLVLKAFDGYMRYHLSANHARRMALLTLPKAEKELYVEIGYKEKLEAVDEGIRRNSEFIDEMVANPVFSDMLSGSDEAFQHTQDCGHHQSHGGGLHDTPHVHTHSATPQLDKDPRRAQIESDMAQEKVRSTLRSFVRDWSVEGEPERKACYEPILEALDKYFPSSISSSDKAYLKVDEVVDSGRRPGRDRSNVRVLIPGCGLGRLAMEIAAQGFFSQGNEFSAYMLIASDWVLNQTTQPESHVIFPYLHSYSNHLTTKHHLLRSLHIPDVCPSQVFGRGRPGPFSLVAGDFEDIYGPSNWNSNGENDEVGRDKDDHRGQWNAVVTCFFIDCARNILNFLKIIHTILDQDGIWINIGPLLWHFENSSTTSVKGESSIELSMDEVKVLARRVGFELREEKMIKSTYTGIPEGMLRHEYNAAFWVATKLNQV
ncbi:hypothetical protein L204_105247 [Cryptococcus depauperatus]